METVPRQGDRPVFADFAAKIGPRAVDGYGKLAGLPARRFRSRFRQRALGLSPPPPSLGMAPPKSLLGG